MYAQRLAPHVIGALIALLLVGLLAFRRDASVGVPLPGPSRVVSSELACTCIGRTNIQTAPPLRWEALRAALSDDSPSPRVVSSASREGFDVGFRIYTDNSVSLVLPPGALGSVPTAEILNVLAADDESLFASGLIDAPIRILDTVTLNRKSGLGVWTRTRHRDYGQQPDTQSLYLRCAPRRNAPGPPPRLADW